MLRNLFRTAEQRTAAKRVAQLHAQHRRALLNVIDSLERAYRTTQQCDPEDITPEIYAALRRDQLVLLRMMIERAEVTVEFLDAIEEFGYDRLSGRSYSGQD